MVPRMAALVIQDFSPIDLDPMTALLRQFGFEVVTASDGETGLKIASTQSPDVIISDAVMPDMSGAELCRRVRSHYKLKTTPILLVSGLREDSEPVLNSLQAGADDYLKMPYEPMQLLSKSIRLGERRRAEKSLGKMEICFRLMIENSADRITLLKEDSTTVYESRAAEHQTGFRPDELVGKNCLALIHPDDRERVMDAEIGALVEYRHLHKDGSWRVLESIGQRFSDESGTILAVLNTRDITGRKPVN